MAIVAAALVGFLALDSMARDIFPDLGVPVLYVAQPYGGLDPAQMEGFIVSYYEYHFLFITGIEHVESKSVQGIGLIKLQFHPGTNMAQAVAETVSYVDRARAFMPTGTVPPFVMRFDGGSVPVGDLVFSSKTKTVAELQDAALFKVRPLFATLPGVSAPPPFGSSQRTIIIRADPGKLRAYNMSPAEVVQALSAGNIVNPIGQRPHRGPHADSADQFGRFGFQGPKQHSYPLAGNADHLHPRHRIGRRQRRHPDRLRAGGWTPHRLRPDNQTGGRLDARGRPSRQSQLTTFPIRTAGRH
jgi:multidrug efflux pump subunit AcrB